MALPENPENRLEQYLQNIAGGSGDIPATPSNRLEQYLAYIAENVDHGETLLDEDITFIVLPESGNPTPFNSDEVYIPGIFEYTGALTVTFDGKRYANLEGEVYVGGDFYAWGAPLDDEAIPDFSDFPFSIALIGNGNNAMVILASTAGTHSVKIQGNIPEGSAPSYVTFSAYALPEGKEYDPDVYWPASPQDEELFENGDVNCVRLLNEAGWVHTIYRTDGTAQNFSGYFVPCIIGENWDSDPPRLETTVFKYRTKRSNEMQDGTPHPSIYCIGYYGVHVTEFEPS